MSHPWPVQCSCIAATRGQDMEKDLSVTCRQPCISTSVCVCIREAISKSIRSMETIRRVYQFVDAVNMMFLHIKPRSSARHWSMESSFGHHTSGKTQSSWSSPAKGHQDDSPNVPPQCMRNDWENCTCPHWSTEGTIQIRPMYTNTFMAYLGQAQKCYPGCYIHKCSKVCNQGPLPTPQIRFRSGMVTPGILQLESGW